MRVLIVESKAELGVLWQKHLERQGMSVTCVQSQIEATGYLAQEHVDVIVLDLILAQGSALAVADFAEYRQPLARVVFVTNTSFFSDGSIFAHAANARAFLCSTTPPEDLAAMVEYYGQTG